MLLSCGLFDSKDVVSHTPSVLFLVSDTTRADLFGEAETPNLNALADSPFGQMVDMAVAPSSWTSPSVLSMMTGKSVREHGWDFPIAQVMIQHKMEYSALSDDTETLAEVLSDNGFSTQGFIANRFLVRDLGFSKGFDKWEYMTDEELPVRTLQALEASDAETSHFFYVHFFGPHQPLRPTAESLKRHSVSRAMLSLAGGMGHKHMRKSPRHNEVYRTLYQAVIEETDSRMGTIVDAFLQKFPDGRIVMTSDHGEMMGEHGEIGHKSGLYQELIHVPLVLYGWERDGQQQGRVGELFSLTAIPDWITDSIGVEHAWDSEWDEFSSNRETSPMVVSQRDGDVSAIRSDKKKLILDFPMTIQNGHFFQGEPTTHLFDLSVDPKEVNPLLSNEAGQDAQNETIRAELSTELETWQSTRPLGIADGKTQQTNRAFIEDLRKLGYVSDER
jgi:arylsulfatase A-like enzyme